MLLACATLVAAGSGCSAFPDRVVQPQYHNPFPQLYKIAILPFYNQSDEPTVDGDEIAMAYYNELQAIPGFEVMPVGVAKQLLRASGIEPRTGSDFQELAARMGVDAVLIGSITEYSPYYPPRMGLAVDWYAANPGFHPIPPGYGLPFGTADEEFIPTPLVREAEFALAREQLKTQTPVPPAVPQSSRSRTPTHEASHTAGNKLRSDKNPAPSSTDAVGTGVAEASTGSLRERLHGRLADGGQPATAAMSPAAPLGPPSDLPSDWPDPRGFIPLAPSPERPPWRPQSDPIVSHTRIYRGQDAEFTERLANYFYFRDDARFGGWEGYLQRPEDFVRFCCHLHVTETLAARGGAMPGRVVWRWPISRYDR